MLSHMSTLPFAKSAAYSVLLSAEIARPVKTECDAEPSMAVVVDAAAGGGVGQPWIVPASVAKMKRDATCLPATVTGKPDPPLKTVPVGPPGTVTTRACGRPVPSYRVELFVPWFATHHGVVGPATRPQPLTRCVSVWGAYPAWSETSGVTA